jgi:hypothetical protein
MATWFSDHYTVTGVNQTALPALRGDAIPDTRRKHGRLHISRGYAEILDSAAADVVRMMTIRSDAHLHWICLFSDGGFSASNSADVGIYLSGDDHDGALVDVDLFDAAVDVTAAISTWDAAEIFTDGVLTGEHRGLPMWELANAGADTLTADPRVLYDITVTLNGDDSAAASKLVMEIGYTAGD